MLRVLTTGSSRRSGPSARADLLGDAAQAPTTGSVSRDAVTRLGYSNAGVGSGAASTIVAHVVDRVATTSSAPRRAGRRDGRAARVGDLGVFGWLTVGAAIPVHFCRPWRRRSARRCFARPPPSSAAERDVAMIFLSSRHDRLHRPREISRIVTSGARRTVNGASGHPRDYQLRATGGVADKGESHWQFEAFEPPLASSTPTRALAQLSMTSRARVGAPHIVAPRRSRSHFRWPKRGSHPRGAAEDGGVLLGARILRKKEAKHPATVAARRPERGAEAEPARRARSRDGRRPRL